MDMVDPRRRREIMARIGPRNTAPELAVRRLAHRLGFRFRLHRKDLPGCPDLVFPRHQLALFVHGCFWHRHIGCPNCTWPKTRPEFWATKFRTNVERDQRAELELRRRGWRVGVIWECETENPAHLKKRLADVMIKFEG
jgi:DNA mismatch endonuclease, patch repair protein